MLADFPYLGKREPGGRGRNKVKCAFQLTVNRLALVCGAGLIQLPNFCNSYR